MLASALAPLVSALAHGTGSIAQAPAMLRALAAPPSVLVLTSTASQPRAAVLLHHLRKVGARHVAGRGGGGLGIACYGPACRRRAPR